MIALLLSTEGELAAENPEAVAVMMVEARNYGLQECTVCLVDACQFRSLTRLL